MFPETRYALNGDLRVAYRASREGPRDIVYVPYWFTCCEVVAELPSIQGWVEAMTSLGRLIFFDQPGTGASDPVTPGRCRPWSNGPTASLRCSTISGVASGSRRVDAAFAPAALFAATHPSRTTALVVLDGYAEPAAPHSLKTKPELRRSRSGARGVPACHESGHAVERGDPGSVGPAGTPGGKPKDASSDEPLESNWTCGRCFRRSACRPSSSTTPTTLLILPAMGKYIAEHIPDAKYVEVPGRNFITSSNPGGVLPGGRRVPHRPAGRHGR